MKTRLWCIAFLASVGLHINAQSGNGNSATLIVTEICVANIDQTVDYSNNYGGWIELYNPTASGISLDDWYISDDAGTLQKHRLTGYVIPPPCTQGLSRSRSVYGASAVLECKGTIKL